VSEHYSIFRKFSTLEQAKEIESLLNQNDIESVLDDNIPPLDVTFSGNTLNNQIEIRIKQSDFKKAENVLLKDAQNLINEIDKDYYLFEFNNEELYEILLKSDEWSSFDYSLAQNILSQRGKSIDEELLNSLKTQRLKELAKPEGNQHSWIIGGYIFALLGGFIGLIIGYFLWTSKKTLPNGQKVHSYSKIDRMHGKFIFYISLIIFPLTIILKIISQS
jgi:hypothetical protein